MKTYGMGPSLSVVIPTYNRLAQLKRVLAGLNEQTVPAETFEVIVVSDGSSDGTNEFLSESTFAFTLLLSIAPSNEGPSAARNRGVSRATSALVLFLDDDVVPSAELIAEHLRSHAAYGEGVAVLGTLLTPKEAQLAPWVRWEQAMIAKQYRALASGNRTAAARQFWTGNASIARIDVVTAGGFDRRFRRGEDVELGHRLAERGVRFVFNPQARAYHWAERSFASWLEMAYAYGRTHVVVARDGNRDWLLQTIWHELRSTRHPMVRMLTRIAVGRRTPTRIATGSLCKLGSVGNQLGLEALVRMAYSGIFNLRYYQGVADELGGREAFLAGVASSRFDFAAESVNGAAAHQSDKRLRIGRLFQFLRGKT